MSNYFTTLRVQVEDELRALAADISPDPVEPLPFERISVELPRDPAHGDIATNGAMVLAKPLGCKPRNLADALAARLLKQGYVVAAETAGPGFVNLRLAPHFWHERLLDSLSQGDRFGAEDLGHGAVVNVEYVSANPTGPMHVGHGRGAVFGDVLASLLAWTGHRVIREYYVNDAGAQVDVLARSLHLRYREALGEKIAAIPEGLYPGEYLIPVARALADRDGKAWLETDEAEWLPPLRAFAIDAMLGLIRDDLAALGISHDVFTSERELVAKGAVEEALATLEGADLIYTGVLEAPKGKLPEDWEARPQTLFRATAFGDDVDRPLRKSDGSYTYFASDIAYHLDKYRRGASTMINVFGADHGGYVKRMRAAVKAITGGKAVLDVKLCQLVNLLEGGVPVKMSKRAGSFVTLREVVERVGKDVVRFIMLTRRNDVSLDFDLEKVLEQSRDNPVFYVQYAHARCRSVLRHAAAEFPHLPIQRADLAKLPAKAFSTLEDPAEIAVIRLLAGWPQQVVQAATTHEPHRLAFYLYDVAAAFHGLWNRGKEDARLRFLTEGDDDATQARLGLVTAVASVIAIGLNIFGVTPVEEMH